MALKRVVDDIGQVPEAQRGLYEQKDGKFVLAVEGDDPALAAANAKVTEFRDSNTAILRALGITDGNINAAVTKATQLAGVDPAKWAALKDVDPAAYAALVAKVQALEAKGVSKPDDIATQITAAVTAAMKPMQERLDASDARAQAAEKRAADSALRTAVAERFLKAGGKAKAVDFIVGQAGSVFEVADGVVKAKANQYSAKRPGNAIDIDEWLESQAKENDFAFETSGGGGAAPGNGSNGNGRPAARPGVRQVKNPSPQELGRFHSIPGKPGLYDKDGTPVEIVSDPAPAAL